MSIIHVQGMVNIGDSIYARPFIKRLSLTNEVYVTTGLPHLIYDLKVKIVKPQEIKYRSHQAELKFAESIRSIKFVKLPDHVDKTINYHYGAKDLKVHGILGSIENKFGFKVGSTDLKLDLPHNYNGHLELPGLQGQKVAVIRSDTQRKEWSVSSRAPNPHYINWCARKLKDAGYFVVSIANCADDEEWLIGDLPPADLHLHNGELNLLQTFTLLRLSSVVVGGPGFIVPAALATNANLFIIFGGRGEYDNPHNLLDLRLNLKKVGWAIPDNFCRCNQQHHTCDKTISKLDDSFFNFMGRVQ